MPGHYSAANEPRRHATVNNEAESLEVRLLYWTNGLTSNSGAMSQTRHQASASSSVRPEDSSRSRDLSVTTQSAWSTSHQH
jgi:hypothetical protein